MPGGLELGALLESLIEATRLILSPDPELVSVTLLSLTVSLIGVFFAGLLAIPFGIFLGLRSFRGRGIVVNIFNTFMGLPPVIVAL
jgi:tungstate transport system permease protein